MTIQTETATARKSQLTITVIMALVLTISFAFGLFRQNRVIVDAPSFYAYLPAAVVYNDLQLNFIDDDPGYFKDKIWFYRIEDGRKLIKHPVGFSVVMAPFFVLGHMYAKATGAITDGYSLPYQNFMSIGVFVYLAIGLYFLRKLLLRWFSDGTVALTLFGVVIATNLLWYSTFEGLMTHSVSFSFLCAVLYYFFRWKDEERPSDLFLFLLLFAFVILIRPVAATIAIYFLLYLQISNGLADTVQKILSNKVAFISGILAMIIIGSIQLIYWKTATGSWIYDVYKNERFIFNSPQMIPFLFSFRKGLFIYSPFLLLIIPGLFFLYRSNRAFFWSTTVLFLLTVYIVSSWWAWSYGISWGVRPMIDYYSFLSIPIAAGIERVRSSKRRIPLFVFILCTIVLNLFQTWQYKNELIHYDDMSREAYLKGFFQTTASEEWKDALQPYNWRRRVLGLKQIEYSKQQFKELKQSDTVYVRGANQMYLSASAKADFILACYFREITSDEQFFIYHLGGDTAAIKTRSGRFLSVKPTIHNVIVADSPVISDTEKFVFEYVPGSDNQFRIKAINGLYLTPEQKFPHIVRAKSATAGFNESFRIFMLDDYRKDF